MKQTRSRPFRRLPFDHWRYHYEVLVLRHGGPELLARVPSRATAERTIRQACRQLEVRASAFRWRRTRGVHPRNVAKLCTVPLVLSLLLPWSWLAGGLSLIWLAVIGGLLTSGQHWMRGGGDDR